MISTRTASNGKMIKPSSVLCRIPAFSSACTSPCPPPPRRFRRRMKNLLRSSFPWSEGPDHDDPSRKPSDQSQVDVKPPSLFQPGSKTNFDAGVVERKIEKRIAASSPHDRQACLVRLPQVDCRASYPAKPTASIPVPTWRPGSVHIEADPEPKRIQKLIRSWAG